MRFGICNEMFEGWKLEDVFRKASELGYSGVEIAPFTLGGRPTEIPAAERHAIRASAARAGVEIIGLHWLLAKTEGLHLTSPDRDTRARTVKYLQDLVRLSADLGGSVLVLGSPQQRSVSPPVTHDEAREYAREALSQVGKAAEELGQTVCLEPLGPEETNFVNTADEAWELASSTGSPAVKIILDVKAMSTEARPVPDIIAAHASHAGHVHANDPNRRGPGFGDVDFRPIFKALRDAGYDRYVSVEVFDFRPDPVTIARQSIDYMRRSMPE